MAHSLSVWSAALGWMNHFDHYLRDFGPLQSLSTQPLPDPAEPPLYDLYFLLQKSLFDQEPFSLPTEVRNLLAVNSGTRKVLRLYSVLNGNDATPFKPSSQNGLLFTREKPAGQELELNSQTNQNTQILRILTEEGVESLDDLPFGIAFPLREALLWCKHNPPANLSSRAYLLMDREDLAYQIDLNIRGAKLWTPFVADGPLNKERMMLSTDAPNIDGTELENELCYYLFSKDDRLKEVRKCLTSSTLQAIDLEYSANQSDHDLVLSQQKELFQLLQCSLSLSVGRGMFTLGTAKPIFSERIQIPELCLQGRSSQTKALVSLDPQLLVMFEPENFAWPEFHNGVAAGLRLPANLAQITSTWITFNEPAVIGNSYAGVLLALGLQGYLERIPLAKVNYYLSLGHEITSAAILLGVSVSKRGSMDSALASSLCLHIDPLNSSELTFQPAIQTATLMSLGLVYQESGQRRMTEIFFNEMNKFPITNREGYVLAAGFALGWITLGKGKTLSGLSDLNLEDQLIRFIEGGNLQASEYESSVYSSESLTVSEGKKINTNLTAPAALLALAMMYLKTEEKVVATHLQPPSSYALLCQIRPDLHILRTLSYNLIMWNQIQPTQEWFKSQVPEHVRNLLSQSVQKKSVDYDFVEKVHLFILAGACFSIGFKYAGTFSTAAASILKRHCHYFQSLYKRDLDKKLQNFSSFSCLTIATLSLSMVLAGTGDLEALRFCRYLRQHSSKYGSATLSGMTMGLLFLGGGRYSLKNNNTAIAAMLCAFYPCFPRITSDNRFHLQAFRHLYVIAVEKRCLEVYDVESHQPAFIPLKVQLKQGKGVEMVSPCLLPPWGDIQKIRLDSPRYWSQEWNLQDLATLSRMVNQSPLFAKKKIGFLSYLEDPQGFSTLFSRPFPKDNSAFNSEDSQSAFLKSFQEDPKFLKFAQSFCNHDQLKLDPDFSSFCTQALYECLSTQKPEMLPTYIHLYSIAKQNEFTSFTLRNLSLVLTVAKNSELLQRDLLLFVDLQLKSYFASHNFVQMLSEYFSKSQFEFSKSWGLSKAKAFSSFLTFYHVPNSKNFHKLKEATMKIPKDQKQSTLSNLLAFCLPYSPLFILQELEKHL